MCLSVWKLCVHINRCHEICWDAMKYLVKSEIGSEILFVAMATLCPCISSTVVSSSNVSGLGMHSASYLKCQQSP